MNAGKTFAVVVAVSAVNAFALDATLQPNGDIRFGSNPRHVLHVMAARPDWQRLSAKGGYTIDRPGVASFHLKDSTNILFDAEVTLQQMPEGKAKAVYTFTPREDVPLATLCCTITLPAAEMSGRPWRSGTRSGTFTHPPRGGLQVFGGKAADITMPLASTGRTITFTADGAMSVLIQDDHRWADTYSLRIGLLGSRTWRRGETAKWGFVISADEPLAAKCVQSVVIRRGPDWIPFDFRKDIVAGSALDFSQFGFTDAPAGKHGWLRNVGGHFEFERRPGRPMRFYGVNLCGTANFPTHEDADRLVTRLKRTGYNTIRLHHHDSGTVEGSADGLTLHAPNMDRFDYLLATAIREGMYLTTDLYVSRAPIRWRDIGIDRKGVIEVKNVFKILCALHEPAFENWCAYARTFLLHRNPYTGRRYVDEPAMPLISLINEGGFFMGWHDAVDEPVVKDAWRRWLAEKRAADPSFHPAADPDSPPRSLYNGKTAAVSALFMGEMEKRMVVRMKAFLRSLGCKALLTNDNCGPHFAPLEAAAAEYDYVDDHFYVDHPQFLERKWNLPSKCGNRNPVQMPSLPLCTIGFARLVDRPFTVTEWNFSAPGMFRGVGGILTGAMAALQDWDGLWRFAYAHNRNSIAEDPKFGPDYFNLSTDPMGQASDRASICLFLRGDLAPLAPTVGVSMLVTPASVDPADGRAFPAAPPWSNAAWSMRVGSALSPADASGLKVVPRELADDPAVTNGIACGADGPLRFDRTRGSFTIATRRTCGVFAPEGAISAGPLDVDISGAPAAVWVTALDSAPVSSSRRLLATHLTDAQREGNLFADEEMTILLRRGSGILVRNGQARMSLSLDKPAAYAVYGLDTGGRRLETMPTTVRGGRLEFSAAVDGPHGARMLYEIVREDR
ncbi:MAG: hypothetical protein IKO72_04155 [Kiritimatiellae bacterium]|nr:hypothetical protein [Kiritimatiellia bacterium]